MRLRCRYVEVASRYSKIKFSLTREEGEQKINIVSLFKYLGRPLEQSDDNCPEVIWNIRKERQV